MAEKDRTMQSLAEAQDNVGKRLKSLRLRAGMTQQAVADEMGVTAQMISRMERGDVNFSFMQLWGYARAVGTELKLDFDDGSTVSDAEFNELFEIYRAAPMQVRFSIRSLLNLGAVAAGRSENVG